MTPEEQEARAGRLADHLRELFPAAMVTREGPEVEIVWEIAPFNEVGVQARCAYGAAIRADTVKISRWPTVLGYGPGDASWERAREVIRRAFGAASAASVWLAGISPWRRFSRPSSRLRYWPSDSTGATPFAAHVRPSYKPGQWEWDTSGPPGLAWRREGIAPSEMLAMAQADAALREQYGVPVVEAP